MTDASNTAKGERSETPPPCRNRYNMRSLIAKVETRELRVQQTVWDGPDGVVRALSTFGEGGWGYN